jgi:hypothetical protein
MPTVHPSQVGAKLGPRIAMLVSQAIIYTHARLVGLKHKVAMLIFHAISDEISEEVDITLGPILQKLHDATPVDHPVYPAVHFLHTATGQLKAMAGTGLQISGLLGAISTIINNELAPSVYGIVSTNPHLLPDPSTVMQMAAASLIPPNEAIAAAAAQGFDAGWANNMLMLTKTWPDVSTALELLRRSVITADTFALWAGLNGVDEAIVGLLLTLQTNPISAADAALAVLRGNITSAQAEQIATENGITADSFQILINNTGEPPGLQQLLEAYRRGFIDKATLEQGIRDSRYRDQWIPMLEQLRYEPMTTADAVNATVQDQLDLATAEKYADQNGLQPGDFQILLNTAGEPLARTELEQLFNRGLIDQATVEQGLRESRLKNKYVADAFRLHEKVLPVNTLQRALRYGGVTHADAIRIAMESGYSETDATTVVNSGSLERTQVYKDRVVESIIGMYEGNLMLESDALSMIQGLGYTSDETSFIIKSSEFKRTAHITEQVVSAIHSKYVAHHIDETTASGFLDAVGVPSAQRDQLIALWKIQTEAYTRTLTEAQVIKALTNSLITSDDATARLEAMGYNSVDAGLLIGGA